MPDHGDASPDEFADRLESVQRLIAELHEQQEPTLEALTRVRAQIEGGEPGLPEDVAQIIRWNDALAEAGGLAALGPETVSLSRLTAAVAQASSELRAASEHAALAAMVADIASAQLAGGRAAVGVAVTRIAGLDPARMTAEEKIVTRALHRVMTAAATTAVDDGDAGAVVAAFGMSAFLAAVGVLDVGEGTPAGNPVVPVAEEPAADPPALEEEPRPAEEEPIGQLAEIPPDDDAAQPAPVIDEPIGSVSYHPVIADDQAGSGQSVETQDGQAVERQLAPQYACAAETRPDPRLAAAISNANPGLAYWYSVALELPGAVQDAFEVLALSEAVAVDGDPVSGRIREISSGWEVDSLGQLPEYLTVFAAGTARALLRMPFSPCSDALLASVDRLPPGRDRDFLHAVWEAGTFGFDLTRLSDVRARSLDDFMMQRDDALKYLFDALGAARAAKTKYSPASDVLHRIMSDREPLGKAVSAVLATPDDLGPAELMLAELRDQKAVDRLIDETHLTQNPVAARKAKIVSGARDQVRSRVADVLEGLRQYLEAARSLQKRRNASGPDVPTLNTAIQGLKKAANTADDEAEQSPGDLGAVAVAWMRGWARDALAGGAEALAVRPSPIETDMARAFEAERSDDGEIDPGSVTLELLDTIMQRSAEDAYEGFAAADDFAGIERIIDTLRAGGETEVAERLADRQPEDVKISRERLRRLAEKAERELALALFAALLSESQSADLGVVLARYRNPDVDDFRVARRHLDDIIRQVEASRARGIDEARAQLSELDCTDEVRTRITRQLDDGDLVTAQEFLAQLKAGSYGLPDEAATDETFGEFWPRFVQESTLMAAEGADVDWIGKVTAEGAAIAGRYLLPLEAAPVVGLGLTGWRELTTEKRGGPWERWLNQALYLLGFEVRSAFQHNPSRRSGQWSGKFTAKLVGRALVPAYGSSADGQYQLLLCWGKQTPERIVEMVEELSRQAPVIVLAFSTLSMRDRRTLAEHARKKGTSAVIIDHAMMAFLATRGTARLQTTMGLALPFTAINPYTPFVLGDVPREVFYGRREELRDVQDANGPLFVYGGRQLGKSTLLKTAKREFAETDSNWRSVYVDLKAEGVGELRVPDDLWSVLVPRLQQAEIIDRKMSAKASPETVVTAIRDWLDEDTSRRFLLLLDEADAFLETDARPRRGQAGESRFVNVYRLKSLMDGSYRRFKPVFAGLHQVQRFHSVSNGPMAHVGTEILIGPLPPSEAYKLVVEPLAAIGYRFERPDIAWRLLAYTNYQASLVQAFCNALVRRLHSRERLAPGAPPTVITDRDIEEVYGDREVRDWIASRFELTINLDNRYRVIAYATAMMTNDFDRAVFAVSTLLDSCKTFWRAGFQGLNLDDFSAYLDEMVGLGVLVRTTGDEYGIRSPNVIRLLGSPTEIERRLMESEDVLEVSSLFDPAVFRRKIGDDPDRRSPLTEQQVQQILEGRRRLHVVVGSPALGLDRERLDIEVYQATCQSLHGEITRLSPLRSGRQHVVLDLAEGSEEEQRSAVQRLYAFVANSDRRSASCLAGLSADWLWADGGPHGIECQQVHLQLWTQDTLRAWEQECQYPLSTASQRRLLLDDTGGWPFLVETAARAARTGVPDQRARQEALSLLDGGAGDFLASVQIPDDPTTRAVVRSLVDWSDEIHFEDLATLVPADTNDMLLALSRLINLGVASNGSSSDSYRVNSLIARLLREQ